MLVPRVVCNGKARQRLRAPLLAVFELLHGRSLLAALTPRKASDYAGRPLEPFRPTKLAYSESIFAPELRRVEVGVLEDDARPIADGFEPVDHRRTDDRAVRPRVCEPSGRFAFQHLAAHHE